MSLLGMISNEFNVKGIIKAKMLGKIKRSVTGKVTGFVDKQKGHAAFGYFENFLKKLTEAIPAPGGQHAIRLIEGKITLEIYSETTVHSIPLSNEDFESCPESLVEEIKELIKSN